MIKGIFKDKEGKKTVKFEEHPDGTISSLFFEGFTCVRALRMKGGLKEFNTLIKKEYPELCRGRYQEKGA